MAPQSELSRAREVARMLVLGAERVKADFESAVEPFGIAPPLARVLLMLDSPIPMREVARHLACDPSYVTGIADQLEQAGLITRQTGADRRVKLLATTEKGARLASRMTTAVTARAASLQRLSPEQSATLVALIAELLGPEGSEAVEQTTVPAAVQRATLPAADRQTARSVRGIPR